MPALNTVATELTKDERDLAWRVDWIKTTDAQPLGITGRITAYAPTTGGPNSTFDLDAALTATGLTTAEQQHAKEAILGGEDFTDAIDAERSSTSTSCAPCSANQQSSLNQNASISGSTTTDTPSDR